MADTGSIYSYDLSELKRIDKMMKNIKRLGGRVGPPLKKWGVYHLGQTSFGFAKGGRPGNKWKKLAPLTKIMRKYRSSGSGRTNPGRILQDSGHLKRSVKTVTHKRRGVDVQVNFTRVPYAKTHQQGGTMQTKQRVIVPIHAKALRWESGGVVYFARRVVIPAKTVKVPQRRFLFITPRDKKKALSLITQHAKMVTDKARIK